MQRAVVVPTRWRGALGNDALGETLLTMVLDVDESLRVCCMDFSDVISRLRACTPCLPRFRAGCEIRNRSKRRDFQKSALPKILLARSRGERSEPSLPSLRRANRNRICVMAAPKGPKTFATLEEAKADMKVLIEELLSNKEALLAIAADPENDTQQKKIAKLMPKLVQILGPKLVEKGFCAAPAQASMGACPDAQTPGWDRRTPTPSSLSHERMECARGVAGIMMGAMACQKAAAPVEAGGFAGGEVIKEGARCSSMHVMLPLWRVSADAGALD